MAGLLSGLSEIGLGGLENMEVYEQPEDKEAEKQAEEKPEVKEETFLFDKSYECPVCYQGFKAKQSVPENYVLSEQTGIFGRLMIRWSH